MVRIKVSMAILPSHREPSLDEFSHVIVTKTSRLGHDEYYNGNNGNGRGNNDRNHYNNHYNNNHNHDGEDEDDYYNQRHYNISRRELNVKLCYIALMALLFTIGLVGLWIWTSNQFNVDNRELSIPIDFFSDNQDIQVMEMKGKKWKNRERELNEMKGGEKGKGEEITNKRVSNAVILILCRNSDLKGMLASISSFESRFNNRYHYPYLFLNNEPFTKEFKETIKMAIPKSQITFDLTNEPWKFPSWIDKKLAREKISKMTDIIYGTLEGYHHMCRYFSGPFIKHPRLNGIKWFWRLEPGVEFTCMIREDPFKRMEEEKKTIGFTILMKEIPETIPTLWQHVSEYAKGKKKTDLWNFVNGKDGKYTGCHFWNNFLIGKVDFFRSKEYQEYFDYLDKKGGFYYERWGDAPVETIGIALLLKRKDILYFSDLGYKHSGEEQCPKDWITWRRNKCTCDTTLSLDRKQCDELFF